jgi:voltage-gated potassium channel
MTPVQPTSRKILRDRVREVMEPYSGGPGSTWMSLAVDLIVLALIVASCTMVVFEWSDPRYSEPFRVFEGVFTALFIVEYLLRWYGSQNRLAYPVSMLAILDFLAIVPGVLMLGSNMLMLRLVRGARLLRLLRLLRLVRILRLVRYGPLIYRGVLLARIWLSSIIYQYRLHQLGRLFLWAVVVLFVGANVLHVTESSLGGDNGPFGGYWRSYWNILIVLVSGIEDKEPVSLIGRLEVTGLLIAGIVIIGMLTGEIVSILIRRAQRAGQIAVKPPFGHFARHIVILGCNHLVNNIIEQVHAALRGPHHFLIVHPNADQLPLTNQSVFRRVYALAGEARDSRTLEAADIDDAARVIVLAPERDACDTSVPDNIALMSTVAVVCRKRAIPMVVELTDEESLRYTHGLPEIDFIVARAFGERMLSQAVLNPGVTEVYDHLLNFSDTSNEIYCIPVPDALVGSTFTDAQLYFLDSEDEAITLIGVDHSPQDAPLTSFVLCPDGHCDTPKGDKELCASDRLLVLAYHRPATGDGLEPDPWSATSLVRE